VSFDAERHRQNLSRWAAEDMVWFGLKGWPPRGVTSGGGIGWMEGSVRRMVRMSATAGFHDPEDRWIGVTSHRQDDDRFAQLRVEVVRKAFLADHRTAMDRQRPWPDSANTEWEPAVLMVDREPTPFEVCRFDAGCWVAVGRLSGADVTIDSRGVPLEGLELERIPEPPPDMPTPPPASA
jgi:hypothetical protein